MKSRAFVFLLFVITLFGLSSCQKSEQLTEADIELISPSRNTLIYLPDTLQIKFKIKSEDEIESVDISIVNSNYISLFGTNTVSVRQYGEEIETIILLEPLQNFDDAPYYIRITARFPNGKSNFYFNIQLANKSLAYKGFFLFLRPGINQTHVNFYDQNMNDTDYFSCSGEYLDSEISSFYQTFHLLTEIPASLKSYAIDNQQVNWEKVPDFPNPKFTEIQIYEDIVYAGMESGKIVGYAQLSGQQKLITEVLVDSIPGKIHVLDDFIIGDYQSRLNGERTLVTFYKITGEKKQRHPIDIQIVSFVKLEDPNKVLIIGNENNRGVLGLYNAVDNIFDDLQQIEEGTIKDVYELDNGAILLLIENMIYLHHYKQNITTEIISFQELPDKVYFEPLLQQLVVQFEMKLSFFNYPEMSETSTIDFSKTLKEVQFYYQYD